MNKKYSIGKIVVVLIITLSIACGFFILQTSNLIIKNHEWNSKIYEIDNINKKIDLELSKELVMVNFDNLNISIKKIYETLSEMKNSNDFTKFFFIAKNKELFDHIEAIFKKKSDLIQQYQTLKSLNGDIVVYLGENLKFTKNINITSALYSSLILNKFGIKIDEKTFEEDSKRLLENVKDTGSIDYIFLTKIKDAIDHLHTFSSLNIKNHELNIETNLILLNKALDEYFKENTQTMVMAILLLFLIILISSIRNIYLSQANRTSVATIMQFRELIKLAPDSIVMINKNGKITYANEAFELLSGYKFEEVRGRNIAFLSNNAQHQNTYETILKNIQTKQSCKYENFISKTKNGILAYGNIVAVPSLDSDFDVNGAIILRKDTTRERLITKELNFKTQQIKNTSLTDRLTGLGNHIALMERIDDKKKGIIIYININHFTNLRFFYKTTTVDLILVAIAETLKLCVDTYKMNSTIYRIQLDEFAIWYDGNNVQKDIEYIAEYINAKNIDIATDDGREILPNIDITMGISTDQDTQNTNRLTQAILAHHEAKANDLTVAFYQDNNQIEQQYHKNQLITRMIQYALNQNSVIVECQGIFDVQSSKEPKIWSYETLIRIIDKDGKIHYPGEFLDIAKKTSLYTALTKQVINKAFDLVETFEDRKFSLNLSSIDMVNESVKKLFMQKLEACSNPNHITVEILESEGIDDYDSINPFIEGIKNHGCKLAIDDFGSGYSNYYRMLELNIDYLKIDGSIIKKLPFDENARSVVQTIVEFSNRQGYDVVAEFVASTEILEHIKHYGIKYAQGFLLGKPTHPKNID
ncbi:PAS sensor-containing diguanylate cyclase/phosphodiesterase [Campylobacter iguaniorum]|uniref:PAS sensor-containing diguanylate cyclase/phosphodiesterase n=1 Tax=Campylobacter iguaniorum TaxID=1244531 RepID=A0A076FB18_9BACT|nr:EAL domain-containing protein [Campylobacter iguaniorum]AII15435.1 PAS sensor-containing diguanylate cyclase/phosphodiesterase [Campylobacter iguaniorum]ALV25365.1 PAS sensor-containing diguanylate cyclase/phosphodiesterase [Campylobacter iguaniorum]